MLPSPRLTTAQFFFGVQLRRNSCPNTPRARSPLVCIPLTLYRNEKGYPVGEQRSREEQPDREVSQQRFLRGLREHGGRRVRDETDHRRRRSCQAPGTDGYGGFFKIVRTAYAGTQVCLRTLNLTLTPNSRPHSLFPYFVQYVSEEKTLRRLLLAASPIIFFRCR